MNDMIYIGGTLAGHSYNKGPRPTYRGGPARIERTIHEQLIIDSILSWQVSIKGALPTLALLSASVIDGVNRSLSLKISSFVVYLVLTYT